MRKWNAARRHCERGEAISTKEGRRGTRLPRRPTAARNDDGLLRRLFERFRVESVVELGPLPLLGEHALLGAAGLGGTAAVAAVAQFAHPFEAHLDDAHACDRALVEDRFGGGH